MSSIKNIKQTIREVFLNENIFELYGIPKSKGDIVKIKEPLEDEDPNMSYLVVNDPSIYGDDEGILVQALGTGLSIPPVNRIRKNELYITVPAEKVHQAKREMDNDEIKETVSGVFNEEDNEETYIRFLNKEKGF